MEASEVETSIQDSSTHEKTLAARIGARNKLSSSTGVTAGRTFTAMSTTSEEEHYSCNSSSDSVPKLALFRNASENAKRPQTETTNAQTNGTSTSWAPQLPRPAPRRQGSLPTEQVPIMTLETLRGYTGEKEGLPRLLSVKGCILDVTTDKISFVGAMSCCLGREASRIFAVGKPDKSLLDRGLENLSYEEEQRLQAYFKILTERFPVVALLSYSDASQLFPNFQHHSVPSIGIVARTDDSELDGRTHSSSGSVNSSIGRKSSSNERSPNQSPMLPPPPPSVSSPPKSVSPASASQQTGRSDVTELIAPIAAQLHTAIESLDVPSVKAALTLATLPQRLKMAWTPILEHDTSEGEMRRFQHLIANALCPKSGVTPLHKAVGAFPVSHTPAGLAVKMAAPKGRQRSNDGSTSESDDDAIDMAVVGPSRGLAIVHALLRAGADRNFCAPANGGLTPLGLAIKTGKAENSALRKALTPVVPS